MRSRFITDSERYAINLSLDIKKDLLKISYTIYELKGIQEQIKDKNGNIIDNYREEWVISPEKTVTISIEQLQALKNWKSGCLIGVAFDLATKEFKGFENSTAESFPFKRDADTDVTLSGMHFTPIRFAVPFEEADFTELGIQVIQQEGREFKVTGEAAGTFKDFKDSGTERRNQFRTFLPVITIEGPSSLNMSEFGLFTIIAKQNNNLLSKPLIIYTETDAGYLSKNKVTLINGKGTVSVRALDLVQGDTIELKAGFKYLSNRAYKNIQVV